jgi:hypothetical protein
MADTLDPDGRPTRPASDPVPDKPEETTPPNQ